MRSVIRPVTYPCSAECKELKILKVLECSGTKSPLSMRNTLRNAKHEFSRGSGGMSPLGGSGGMSPLGGSGGMSPLGGSGACPQENFEKVTLIL